ncbi:MAG: arsenite methyltransferase [Ignavibacteria bacterium]
MNTEKEIREMVKEKYAKLATASDTLNSSCGCSPVPVSEVSCCCGAPEDVNYTIMSDEYKNINGYVADADLSLGCGVPTEYAGIKQGDTVVDLGSGAGNDVFVVRGILGDTGKVFGVDMTPEMTAKAERNKEKSGYKNVEFLLGEIESLPLPDDSADVIISNCVLNLVPDKAKAFAEMSRVLKPGGHFCISDIVLKGELPESLKESVAMYAGCIAGALQQEDYISGIEKAGFSKIEIKKTKAIILPLETLKKFISEADALTFHSNNRGIFSITVVGYKK